MNAGIIGDDCFRFLLLLSLLFLLLRGVFGLVGRLISVDASSSASSEGSCPRSDILDEEEGEGLDSEGVGRKDVSELDDCGLKLSGDPANVLLAVLVIALCM
jgi:hypothetical protein